MGSVDAPGSSASAGAAAATPQNTMAGAANRRRARFTMRPRYRTRSRVRNGPAGTDCAPPTSLLVMTTSGPIHGMHRAHLALPLGLTGLVGATLTADFF